MWVPNWLGKAFGKLYIEFELGTFKIKDAKAVLGYNVVKTRQILAGLHARRFITVFKRKRPRIYRNLDPKNVLFLASGSVSSNTILKVKQEEYLNLLLSVFSVIHRKIGPECLALYGSIARGTSQETSDLDLLLVSRNMRGSLGSRVLSLMELIGPEIQEEQEYLFDNSLYCDLNILPLSPDELASRRLFLLDLVDHALVLWDPEQILSKEFAFIRFKLLEMGAQKVELEDGSWCWDLPSKNGVI